MPTREVRKLDPVHVREVANSISALGFCTPILVGKDNLVLDGAVRVQAARLLGLGRAPCVRIENLSETDQRVRRSRAEPEAAASRARRHYCRLPVDRKHGGHACQRDDRCP